MKIRFYFDEEMDAPHIYKHGIDEDEVEDVLTKPITRFAAKDGASAAIGQTQAGRYVEVIYRRDPEPNSFFVITARELQGKPLKALRRQKRRKNL